MRMYQAIALLPESWRVARRFPNPLGFIDGVMPLQCRLPVAP
ncbi:hypothetical protein [Paraburkholderia sp.]